MTKILIVDGCNLLFQMFYGLPTRILNYDGRPVQGVLGFVGALLKIIRMVNPTHMVVLFDGETHNPRTDLDEDYKANRTDYSQVDDYDNPFSQLPDICAALDLMQISYAETTDCEADDWIAGYALRYGAADDISVVISSYDSDFFQLITENVHLLRYRGPHTQICDPAYLKENLGILPGQYADLKSLTGDSSDNIKGVPKIGPKTAAALLQQYGSLESIIASAETIKRKPIRQTVLDHIHRLQTNYQLIKLNGADTLPFTLERMQFTDNGYTTTQVLRGIGLR